MDGNGIYESKEGDKVLKGVPVSLWDATNAAAPVQIGTTVETDSKGEYEFTDLQNGTYIIKFENTDAANRHFSPTQEDEETTFAINSDVTANNDNTEGSFTITLPYEGDFDGAQLYINAGFVTPITVTLANSNTNKGTVNFTGSAPAVTTKTIWPGEKVQVAYTASGENVFDKWLLDGEPFRSNSSVYDTGTITGYWKHNVSFYDEDGTTQLGQTQKVSDGKFARATNPSDKPGKIFVGWKANNNLYNTAAVNALPITADTSFTAEYAFDGKAVVVYDFGGATLNGEGYKVVTGTPDTPLTDIPTGTFDHPGYTQGGWKKSVDGGTATDVTDLNTEQFGVADRKSVV